MSATTNIAELFAARDRVTPPRATTSLGHTTAVLYVALSVLILCYATHVQVFSILLFLTLWLPLPFLKHRSLLYPSADLALMLTIPLLCILSTLWSDDQSWTLYLGTAFVALNLCAVILARTVRLHSLLVGLSLGCALALTLTLIDGTQTQATLGQPAALVGLFGSKNSVGFIAQIGLITSAFIIAGRFSTRNKLLFALPVFALCLACLALSRSGTAMLSLMGLVPLTLAFAAIGRCPRIARPWLLLMLVLAVGGIAVAAKTLDAPRYMLKTLDKDPTLTGRTYLWNEGLSVAMERPALGHGYSAFWRKDQPRAERYWYEFHISSRSGFHFHSTPIQVMVDLGITGLAVVALIVLITGGSAITLLLRRGSDPEILFLLALTLMFLLRLPFEIDMFVGPFGVGALLFYGLLPRLAAIKNETFTRSRDAADQPPPTTAP